MRAKKNIHFIHISDTHIGPQKNFVQYEVNTYECFKRFLEGVNNLEFKPDFIVHTGDIVAEPNEASYRLAKELADTSNIPIYFVAGNHDDSNFIRHSFNMRNIKYLDESLFTYRFILNDTAFIVLDAKGSAKIDPHGIIEDKQLSIIKSLLEKTKKEVVVFLHFSPVNTGIPWLDKNMSLFNKEKLAKILIKHRKKLRGVFFGHIHSSIDIFDNKILYSGVESLFRQFRTWPYLEKPALENKHSPHFNCVTLSKERLTVKHCPIELLEKGYSDE